MLFRGFSISISEIDSILLIFQVIEDYMDMSILQSYDRDTVNSVFYQMPSYNRKNLYSQELIILIFCNTIRLFWE